VEITDPAESSDPYRTLLRIGLGTQLSAYRETNYELVWWAGLRELAAGYASDQSIAPGGVLFLELAWRLDTLFDLHASVGGHMQAIIPVATPVVFGFAPVGGVGARFWAHPNVSIGLDVEVRWTATNTFHAGVPVVPFGTVLVSGGLSVCAHL
jgi:hypothetical protein